MKTITLEQVRWTLLSYPEDDVPIKGNVMASGDPEEDKKAEDWVRRQLRQGNEWAWCRVELVGEFMGLSETEHLGCCSYKSAEDFMAPGGYYEDMQRTILKTLNERAKEIAEALE